MKKLMYLFVAATMFVFTACGGGGDATQEAVVEEAVEEVVEVVEEVVEDTTAAEEAEALKSLLSKQYIFRKK